MKKILTLFVLALTVPVFAQSYPISIINISMPPNPDATMANWGKGNSMFVITATGKSVKGQVDGFLVESKILVTIKKGGTKVCGSYTANSAPASNFNTLTKVWSGTNAVSLIGQDCILSPGDYEICVQFFGYGPAGPVPLSEEKRKMFSIRANNPLTYQPPQGITPTNGTVLSEIDIKKPITFRWTPVVPKPQEPVTYRLKVWQLMQGQNGMQAMQTNAPIVTKDVDNLTQATILNLINGPCKPPYLCNFIWNVQALTREGKPIGGKDGTREALQFTFGEKQESKCLPDYKFIIDKISCKGNQIIIKGQIEVPFLNTSLIGNIFITSIKDKLGNNVFNSYSQLPKQIGSGNVKLNNFEFYINNKNCGHDLVIEYEINSSCKDSKTQGTQIIKDKIIIPAKDIACCDENNETGCLNNPLINGDFLIGSVPGVIPTGQVANWSLAYGAPATGNPIINNTIGQGCFDAGYVVLAGNNISGNAITQTLNSANKIISGKKYTFYVAVRFIHGQTLDYGKIRLIAYNGILPTNGSHPSPQSNIAIIGRSGKIHDCGDWSVIEFPMWKANKNFDKIAVNAFTNDNIISKVYIDNVSACETTQNDCAELQLDAQGRPIPPPGYNVPVPAGLCQPEAEEENVFNGSLVDLYGYDGTTEMYSNLNSDDCMSIGGSLPPEVSNYNCDESLKAEGITMTCSELKDLLNKPFPLPQIKTPFLTPIPTLNNIICKQPEPINMVNMAFHGRDIIYIHGLMLSHLCDRANGVPDASGNWPTNKNEFDIGGYYKNIAVNNWQVHINDFLRARGNLNRYLIVSYDCSENAEVAVHSILTQIRDAMENGTGVQADPSDPRRKNCFGRDYVMISHSTGALVADIALSIANKTKNPGNLQIKYGDIGLISDRCKGHISIEGAFSGSNLAKIMVTAQMNPYLSMIASAALTSTNMICSQNLTLSINNPMVLNSILVDLVPSVTRQRWGSLINDISVPVFNLAGGHPSAILGPLKYTIIPGFDDGVTSMDSSSGSNNSLSWGSSYFTAVPKKVFDMGIPIIRAIDYYLDQKVGLGAGHFAAASTPYLSPTGMVEPVTLVNINPQNHFRNHYSFIQSSREHWNTATQHNITPDDNVSCDYKRTSIEGSTNNDEILVTDDQSLYNIGLINPAILPLMGEFSVGNKIYYPNLRFKRGRFYIYWKPFWIWKRTYHKLNGNCMYDVDYAYKYLFSQ
jgi:hypothetical protein